MSSHVCVCGHELNRHGYSSMDGREPCKDCACRDHRETSPISEVSHDTFPKVFIDGKRVPGVVSIEMDYGIAGKVVNIHSQSRQGMNNSINSLKTKGQKDIIDDVVECMEELIKMVELAAPNMVNAGAVGTLEREMLLVCSQSRRALINLYQWQVMA